MDNFDELLAAAQAGLTTFFDVIEKIGAISHALTEDQGDRLHAMLADAAERSDALGDTLDAALAAAEQRH